MLREILRHDDARRRQTTASVAFFWSSSGRAPFGAYRSSRAQLNTGCLIALGLESWVGKKVYICFAHQDGALNSDRIIEASGVGVIRKGSARRH